AMLRPLVCASIALSSTVALGSVPDVFGLGSTESALCGASSARVHDFSAAHYNPAGLTLVEGPEATLGVLGFGSSLTPRPSGGERTMPIVDPIGIVAGGATPIPFGGALAGRLYVGLALYIVPEELVRVIAHRPEEPFFPLYDNRTQRLVV